MDLPSQTTSSKRNKNKVGCCKHHNCDRLVFMSIGTFILFIAANVSNNLITTVLDNVGFGLLGYYNLGIYYFSFGIFSFLAVPVVMRLGDKNSLILGCFTYFFMIGTQVLPCWRYDHPNSLQSDTWYNFMYGIQLLSCLVNGFGASILYVAQGKYVSEIATSKNIGFFNSIIWLSSMVTIVFGNLISAFVLVYASQSILWIFLTLLCLVAAVFFMFLKPPRPHPVKKSKSKASQGPGLVAESGDFQEVMAIDMTEKKAGVASSQQQLENRMNSMIESGIKVNVNDDSKKTVVGQKLNFSNDELENSDERSNHDESSIDEDEEEEEEQPTVVEEIKATWALFINPRMRRFIPLCTWTALSLAIYQASFAPLLTLGMADSHPNWDYDQQTTAVTVAMISLGIGESVGVLANGWIQDYYGIKIAIYANMAQMVIAFIIILLYTWNNSFNMYTASILNFFWGIQDAGVNNFACCVCGFQFDSAIIPYSLLYSMQSFFGFLFIVIQSRFGTWWHYEVYFLISFVFALFSWLCFLWGFDLRDEVEEKRRMDSQNGSGGVRDKKYNISQMNQWSQRGTLIPESMAGNDDMVSETLTKRNKQPAYIELPA